jgi:hypothetical protein
MKKIIVTCIMLTAVITLASAQPKQRMTQEERIKAQIDRLDKLISLNDTQKTAIQKMETELGKEMNTARQKNQGDREAMIAAMQEINKKRDAQYKTILTSEQFKKYTEEREKFMQNRRQRNN